MHFGGAKGRATKAAKAKAAKAAKPAAAAKGEAKMPELVISR
jgi:hypothetical protein